MLDMIIIAAIFVSPIRDAADAMIRVLLLPASDGIYAIIAWRRADDIVERDALAPPPR